MYNDCGLRCYIVAIHYDILLLGNYSCTEGRGVEWKEWPEIRSGGETETITERKWEGSKEGGNILQTNTFNHLKGVS